MALASSRRVGMSGGNPSGRVSNRFGTARRRASKKGRAFSTTPRGAAITNASKPFGRGDCPDLPRSCHGFRTGARCAPFSRFGERCRTSVAVCTDRLRRRQFGTARRPDSAGRISEWNAAPSRTRHARPPLHHHRQLSHVWVPSHQSDVFSAAREPGLILAHTQIMCGRDVDARHARASLIDPVHSERRKPSATLPPPWPSEELAGTSASLHRELR